MTETMTIPEHEVQEVFFERGWTDGLPVVPPTPERVSAMLEAGQLGADETLGTIPTRDQAVTGEAVAVSATMAGCRPDHFPVVIAAIEAILDPVFNANAALTSTGGAAFCTIVSGPYASAVGINGGHNALGPGHRANATIGRALRLLAMNYFEARPGEMDGSSLGNPGKYSLCFAETAPPEPWEPVRCELGYDRSDTTVTVMATEGPRQIANHLNGEAEGIALTLASAMRAPSSFTTGKGGQAIIVLGPEHTRALIDGGWTQQKLRDYLVQASRIEPNDLVSAGIPLPRDGAHEMRPDADGRLATVRSADDVMIVTAGGAGPGWSAYIPAWATVLTSRAVTRRVRIPGEALPECGPDGCVIPQLGVVR